MLNWYPRLSASSGEGKDEDSVDRYRVFYGIAVACISILLFCVLAASVSVGKACTFAALAALLLSVVGCFAPKMWVCRRGRPASALLALTVGGSKQVPGRACLTANAPPAFAYVCPLERDGGKLQAAASCVMCSVCLEDVHCGEMMRQVPVCRHIFNVECIDMWPHSNRTCPIVPVRDHVAANGDHSQGRNARRGPSVAA